MNNYFSHDSNARNDEKVIRLRMKHGAAGYGVYFMLLERMREETNYMCATDYNMIAFDFRVDASLIQSVVEDFGLFAITDDGNFFYSESFMHRMKAKDTVSKARSEAGRKGAIAKAKTSNCQNDVQQLPKSEQANEGVLNKSKEKESKEKEIKEEREEESDDSAPTPTQGLSFQKFSVWLQQNAPEMLTLRAPNERQWIEVKTTYQTPKKLCKACEEISANETFLTKWKSFHVSLQKWHEQELRLNIH